MADWLVLRIMSKPVKILGLSYQIVWNCELNVSQIVVHCPTWDPTDERMVADSKGKTMEFSSELEALTYLMGIQSLALKQGVPQDDWKSY